MPADVQLFRTNLGARIYRIPLQLFQEFKGYAYLVFWNDLRALVDVGSGIGNSNDELEAGLAEVRDGYGERAGWDDLTHVLISHGHIDHFGGLGYVRERTKALVGVHGLDLRVLVNYEERLDTVAHRLREFLTESGTEAEKTELLMNMYLMTKNLFTSVEVDFTFDSVGMTVGPLRIIHVPGHCPGQVVILVDDVLLSSDHVLEITSPHQAPERLSLNTGLGHYLESLDKILPLADRVRLTLGGHEGQVEDLRGRIESIQSMHLDRLEQVLGLLSEPKTVAQVSSSLFPSAAGYHALLAVEEAGAHVEYLLLRGFLEIENHADFRSAEPIPIRYLRREGFTPPLRIPGEVKDISEEIISMGPGGDMQVNPSGG